MGKPDRHDRIRRGYPMELLHQRKGIRDVLKHMGQEESLDGLFGKREVPRSAVIEVQDEIDAGQVYRVHIDPRGIRRAAAAQVQARASPEPLRQARLMKLCCRHAAPSKVLVHV
jgi:hypothetical protein